MSITKLDELREAEKFSIREFMLSCTEYFDDKKVLDYGCGKQPYRDIIKAANGFYYGYDRANHPANTSGEDIGADTDIDYIDWDVIVINQVIQYLSIENVLDFFDTMHGYLWMNEQNGYLIMTYPTNWPEVEAEDFIRYTKAGVEDIMRLTDFEIIRHEPRAAIMPEWERPFVTGYGLIARAF